MQEFLISITIIAQVLGITIPQAVIEDAYIVPTTIDSTLEVRVMDTIRSKYAPPQRASEDWAPDIDARGALIMDAATKNVLWQKNPDDIIPIASITKLMTALVWLENQPADGMSHVHTFAPEQDTIGGKELNLAHGEKLRAFDLLRSSIVGSDNDTALGLVHTTTLGDQGFIDAMNHKAETVGMTNTSFADPTGLSANNISTPYDIALLAREAFRQPEIQQPASMSEHLQETVDSGKKTRVATTNKLLYDSSLQITGGKTGYTTEAGYCLVVQARVPDTERDVIAVVLGTNAESARFEQAKKALLWTFEHYAWD